MLFFLNNMGILSWPIWICDVSEFDWQYGERESCLLLEGEVEIKTDLENANSNATEVEDMLAEANDIIAKAKKEANSIREKARVEATEVAEAKLSEAKSQMDQKYNGFLTALAKEKDALEKSLIANMPTFKDGLKAKLNSI